MFDGSVLSADEEGSSSSTDLDEKQFPSVDIPLIKGQCVLSIFMREEIL